MKGRGPEIWALWLALPSTPSHADGHRLLRFPSGGGLAPSRQPSLALPAVLGIWSDRRVQTWQDKALLTCRLLWCCGSPDLKAALGGFSLHCRVRRLSTHARVTQLLWGNWSRPPGLPWAPESMTLTLALCPSSRTPSVWRVLEVRASPTYDLGSSLRRNCLAKT